MPRRGQHLSTTTLFEKLFPPYEDDGFPKPSDKWEYEAECTKCPTEDIARVFFPVGEFAPKQNRSQYKEAQEKYCRPCPVKADCLESAIREERGLPCGMRGNTTPYRRKQMWLERKRHKLASNNTETAISGSETQPTEKEPQ